MIPPTPPTPPHGILLILLTSFRVCCPFSIHLEKTKRENFDRVVRWRYLDIKIITIFKKLLGLSKDLVLLMFFHPPFFSSSSLRELVNGKAVG